MAGGSADGGRGGGARDEATRPALRPAARAIDPPADLVPGYRMIRRLGGGGQAVVWEGVQLSTGQRVAVKLLVGGVLATDEARQRFRREMELVAALDHPGIVRLLDSGFAGGQPYHVLALVEGADVATHARRQGLGVAAIVSLVAAAAEALEHAHRNRVIHRDLKPGNVLVDALGRPRLVDFGAGRFEDADDATRAGLFTPSHASPEQLRGDLADTRTDVYSLGVILHELLAGALPWPEPSSAGALPALEACRRPEPPSRRNPRVDRDLDTIVLRALAEDRDRRYESAAALRRDLEHWLAGEPVEARRDSRWYVLRKTVSRHRWTVGAAAAVLVVLVSSAVALALGNERLQDERDRARRAEARARVEGSAKQAVLDLLAAFGETGGDVRLTELFASRAVRSRVEVLSADERLSPEVRAAALLQLARLSARVGDDDEAWRLVDMAGKACDSAPGACPQALRLEIDLAALPVLRRLRKDPEAGAVIDRLGRSADRVASERPDLAARHHAAVALRLARDDTSAARESARHARELLAGAADASAEATLEVAAALRATGDADAARRLLEEAIERRDEVGSEGLVVASALELLADLAADQGDDLEAAAHERRAIALLRWHLGDSTARLALRELLAGRRLLRLGRPDEARLLLTHAADVLERQSGDETPELLDAAGALVAAGELASAGADEIEGLRARRREMERLVALQQAPAAAVAEPPEDPARAPAPGRWAVRRVAEMATARRHHAATRLADGRVLVSGGGVGWSLTPTPTAELYDAVADRWTPAGDLLVPRLGHSAALLPDGRVLVAGGFSESSMAPTDTSEVFRPDTLAFTRAGRLAEPRGDRPPLVVGLDGVAVLLGGTREGVMGTATRAVEAHDPISGRWVPRPPLGLSRRSHGAALLPDGRLLVAGGLPRCCDSPAAASRVRWAGVRESTGETELVATASASRGVLAVVVAGDVACLVGARALECTPAATPGSPWWRIPLPSDETVDAVALDERRVAVLAHARVVIADVRSGARATAELPASGGSRRLTRLDDSRLLVSGVADPAPGGSPGETAFVVERE